MLKFLGVLIIFQSLNTQIYSSYVFVNEWKSWFAALDVCHTRFNGTLSALPLHKTEKLKQCIGTKRIWTGHYREVSKWVSMKGCFSLSIQNATTMKDVSAKACQKYCNNSSTFAVRGKTCACNVQLNSARRTNDSLCNITCDTRAFCGGKDELFSGYQSASKPTTNAYGKQCSIYKCKSNSININGRDCTNNYSVICANNATLSGPVDWTDGLKECISSYQRVIMHMENTSQCYDGIVNKEFWNGIFRAERARQTSETGGLYVFVYEKYSWNNASDICKTRFNGTLPRLPVRDSKALQQCIRDKRIWTGRYTEFSKWMSMEGCFNLSVQNATSMNEVSAQACQKYCRDFSTFAISGRTCVCNTQVNHVRRINDSLCNITCDTGARCGGGDDLFSAYKLAPTPDTEIGDEQCSTFRCESSFSYDAITLRARECNKKHYVICANNATLAKHLNWTDGLKECLSSHQRGIASVENGTQCFASIVDKAVWNGIFRAARLRQSSADYSTGTSDDWDQPEPNTAVTIRHTYGSIKEGTVIVPGNNFSILCEIDDLGLNLTDYCQAPSTEHEVSSTVVTMTTETLKTSTTTKYTAESTDNSTEGPNNPLPEEHSNSAMTMPVIGGAAGGVIIVVLIVITVVFVCERRKRITEISRKGFYKKKRVFNPTYEEPVISGETPDCDLTNTHKDKISPSDDFYYKLERHDDADTKNRGNDGDGGNYFILEKCRASEEKVYNTSEHYTTVDAPRGDNPYFTLITSSQDNDDTYARSAEGIYDLMNNSQERRNVIKGTDDMYHHAKSSFKEESNYDKVRNKEEEITPYGYSSVVEDFIYDIPSH